MTRKELEACWFALTREEMPSVAEKRGWPVRFDHCFQRILLDIACGGPWRDTIAAPAYRNAGDAVLAQAVALGEAAIAGDVDLAALNQSSLRMRGKA